jgi:hypothetical protein
MIPALQVRIGYLCLVLAIAACEPTQADYERAQTDATISTLHVAALRHEMMTLQPGCAAWRPSSRADTAPDVCHRLQAAKAELDSALFDSVNAAAKVRRFEQ